MLKGAISRLVLFLAVVGFFDMAVQAATGGRVKPIRAALGFLFG